MFEIRALTIAALLASGAALAQGQPGDATFCRQYAATVATVAEDAIKMNPACLNPGSGVHGDRQSHLNWCARTPRENVEGASVHIRRLASRCAGLLAPATEYGGYDVIGHGQLERPYGQARQWEVKAAFSGRLFMYCVATNNAGPRSVSIGVDQSMPGDGRQWQLVAPVRSRKDWQGRLEIDGREPANRAGADVSGSSFENYTIVYLNLGQLDALRNGQQAVLGVGKQDFDFSLAGIAAAITKVEECRERRGAVAPAHAQSASGAAPAGAAVPAPLAQPGPEPVNLVETIYRRANSLDKATRAQFLSRQLLGLIERDERESASRNEPGKLEYSLLTGDQDMLKIAGLQVTEVSRQQNRATVRVSFRNIAFKGQALSHNVIYQLQLGDRGWRITNIIYSPQHNLLATLTR